MFDAALTALTQLFAPPLRRVLMKAVGLALLLIVIIGIALNRVFSALAASGATWAEQTTGFAPHAAWATLAWVLSIMASLGIITGALFLMPTITAFVGSFFVDEVADAVERDTYPAEPPGNALPLLRALIEGVKVRFAGAGRLFLRAAVHLLRRARRDHPVPGQRLPARPAIFRIRRHALSHRRTKPRRYARPTRPTSFSPAW